jgi:trehalose 6-phosphate synthase
MGQAGLVIASNRGPLSFTLDDEGRAVPTGSAGGLAAALYPLVEHIGATWVACAMSEADRTAAAGDLTTDTGVSIVMVQPGRDTYRMAYDVISNSTLWNCHHHLFDLARRPHLDDRWYEAFDAYRSLNAAFAAAVSEAAAPDATVLVQDYHLCLVPGLLRASRPDLRVVHFTHTPFADPGVWRVLPAAIGRELLEGLTAATACGFHTTRWEHAFRSCCADTGVQPGHTFATPLTLDPGALAARAAAPGPTAARARLEELIGGRRSIVRVDRVEPSKNLLRGFWAFDDLLRHRRDLRGAVVMVARSYPSRQSLPEYLAYGTEVDFVVERLNEQWGTDDWTPVVLDVVDDTDRSVAALAMYDVLLVNPVRDGLNLVAKEGPLVNTTDGVLALSREAGAFEELRTAVLEVNPFDVTDTAKVLAEGLDMAPGERKRRAEALRALVAHRLPGAWLDDQFAAIDAAGDRAV